MHREQRWYLRPLLKSKGLEFEIKFKMKSDKGILFLEQNYMQKEEVKIY